MPVLFSSISDLVALLERPKWLAGKGAWVTPNGNGRRGLRLKLSLTDGGAILQGVSVVVDCHCEGPDLPMSVVLLAEIGAKPRAAARIDLNGSPHTNRHALSGELMFVDAGPNHFHDTRLHLQFSMEQLCKDGVDLPVARPIGDMPEVFSAVMEKCGQMLHIENLREIEEPLWQPRRFPF